ncbi:MAG TPA: hypothetical protein VNZ52_16900, partial [Candidatus Thermoplasmatota archaeon]|nr:hypothetical protein [Candidatus Thermoplasmatota archaeon]
MAGPRLVLLLATALLLPALAGCFGGAGETPPAGQGSPLDSSSNWEPAFVWFPQAPRPGDEVTFR